MIDRTYVQVKGQEWEDQTGTETEKKGLGKEYGENKLSVKGFLRDSMDTQ